MALLRNVSQHNAGRGNAAQLEIDWSVSRAQAQLIEAMKVDGVELQYWKRVDEGNYCSCSFGLRYSGGSSIGQTVVNNDQTNTQPAIPNLPASQNESEVVVRGIWTEDEPPLQTKVLDTVVDPNPVQFKDLRNQTEKDQPTGIDEAFYEAPEDFDIISGLESTQCGICLGTGKTNPYALIGGRREVFDSFAAKHNAGFALDTSDRPFSWKTPQDTDSYVEFSYTLPTYFKRCLNYSVRNNTKAVRDLKIFYQIVGSNDPWQLLSRDWVNSRNGVPTTVNLRVQPIVQSLDGTLTFTHFEIIWQFSEFPKAQVGEMSVAANAQIRETVMSSSFTLPPTIEEVTKNDVFYDEKHNNMWMVTDYTGDMTAKRQVLNWTVSVRKMQPYEQRALLQIVKERFFEISFSGLEGFNAQMLRDDI